MYFITSISPSRDILPLVIPTESSENIPSKFKSIELVDKSKSSDKTLTKSQESTFSTGSYEQVSTYFPSTYSLSHSSSVNQSSILFLSILRALVSNNLFVLYILPQFLNSKSLLKSSVPRYI